MGGRRLPAELSNSERSEALASHRLVLQMPRQTCISSVPGTLRIAGTPVSSPVWSWMSLMLLAAGQSSTHRAFPTFWVTN